MQNKQELIKQCRSNLDELILNQTHVSLGSKIKTIGKNIKNNFRNYSFLALSIPAFYFVGFVDNVFEEYKSRLTDYISAHEYVMNLNELREISSSNDLEFTITDEMLQIPSQLIQNSKDNIFTQEATESLNFISSNYRNLLGNDEETFIEFENNLKQLSKKSQRNKNILAELLLSIVVYGGTYYKLFSGLMNTKLERPNKGKNKLKKDLKKQKKELLNNVYKNASLLPEYNNTIKKLNNSYLNEEDLIGFLENYSSLSKNKEYVDVFKVVNNNPEFFYDSKDIKRVIKKYDSLDEKVKHNFLEMVNKGWDIKDSYDVLNQINNLNDTRIKNKLLESVKKSKNQFIFTSSLNFVNKYVDEEITLSDNSLELLFRVIDVGFKSKDSLIFENFSFKNLFFDEFENMDYDEENILKNSKLNYLSKNSYQSIHKSFTSFYIDLKYNSEKEKENFIEGILEIYDINPNYAQNVMINGFEKDYDFKNSFKIFKEGFIATPFLVNEIKNSKNHQKELEDWKKIYDNNSKGNFSPNDKLSFNLEYTRYWNNFLATRRSNYEEPKSFDDFKFHGEINE